MPQTPVISVVMPVRNGLPWFREAVESISDQTFADWELLIVDDGSSDGTAELADSLQNDRIRPLRSPGSGLVDALNHGLGMARGRYLARMDADDVSHPARLATQLATFEADPSLGVVYTAVRLIEESGAMGRASPVSSVAPQELEAVLTFRGKGRSIVHPTVMMRTEILRGIGGYRHFDCAEDRDVWLRLLGITCFAALDQPLLSYRMTATGVSRLRAQRQLASALLAVACHEIRARTGVDLYADHPSLLPVLDAEAVRLAAGIGNRFSAFDEVKRDVRQGRLLRAAMGSLRLAGVDPSLLRTAGRVGLHRAAADELSNTGERLLPYQVAARALDGLRDAHPVAAAVPRPEGDAP